MAITFSRVSSSRNQIRYLVTQDGAAGTSTELPSVGGATPDFQTDASLFPLRAFARAGFDGFPPLQAGTFTQAEIRALLLSDDPTSAVLTNALIGRCKAFITPRDSAQDLWAVDAVAASTSPGDRSDPTYVVSSSSSPTAGSAYLDIVFQNTPDR